MRIDKKTGLPKLRGMLAKGTYIRPTGDRLPCFQKRRRRTQWCSFYQVQVGRGEWLNVEQGSTFEKYAK